ncbi:MAG TPA: YfhO family protein [Chitinophagales bacterium]|nr:YfhO family protein [Chitinophagales bacterium]
MKKKPKAPRAVNDYSPSPGILLSINQLSNRNALFLFAVVLFIMLVVLFRQYIFSDAVLLFKDIGDDTINFNWPTYVYCSNYFHTEGIPRWSFAQGAGQNIFPLGFSDATEWLLYLLSTENIPYALAYIQLFKIFVSGILFYLFLRKNEHSTYLAGIGGLVYSFSGFIIIGSTWYIFSTEALYLALLLYATALLRKNNNPLLLPVAVALIVSYNPVFLYMDALLVGAYLLFSMAGEVFNKTHAVLIAKIAGLGALGIAMGAFLMLGNINLILSSPRVTGSVSHISALASKSIFALADRDFYASFILRMLGNDQAGNALDYKAWGNYLEAPMQYGGILSLLLVPQLFLIADKKIKWRYITALFLVLIPVVFPYFRYAFWLFSGDYCRTFSLFIVVLQTLTTLRVLQVVITHRQINIPGLLITSASLLCFVFLFKASNADTRPFVVLFLVAETGFLALIAFTKYYSLATTLLPLLLAIELLTLSSGTINNRNMMRQVELEARTGYNDYTKEAVSGIRSDANHFSRVYKDYTSSPNSMYGYNDALMQGYYAASSYHPFHNSNYVNFLQKMQVIPDSLEIASKYIRGLKERPLLLQIMSNKHILLRSNNTWPSTIGYSLTSNYNGINVYSNNAFLPFGFTYDSIVSEDDMNVLSSYQKDVMILRAAVVNKDTKQEAALIPLSLTDTVNPATFNGYFGLFANLQKDTLQLTSFSNNYISGSINASKPKFLFLSIPYDEGWQLKIDGQKMKKLMVNYGFVGSYVGAGAHKIELCYEPQYYQLGKIVSIAGCLLFIVLAALYSRRRDNTITG